MKTIEEAQNEFENTIDGKNGFYRGVLFAQRWIPVNKQLPVPKNEANELSKVYICKSNELAEEFSGYYDWVCGCWRLYPSGQIIRKVTHFRQINIK